MAERLTHVRSRTEHAESTPGDVSWQEPKTVAELATEFALEGLPKVGGSLRERYAFGLQQTLGNQAVQRLVNRSRATAPAEDDLAQRIATASAGGNPLDTAARERLQASLGVDLSGVRVHLDEEADRLAESVKAVAFTTGKDIFFRSGMYQPETASGFHLLAHEVTHTLQQANGPVEGTLASGNVSISEPGDASEREAEAAASRVTQGQSANVRPVASPTVARGVWDSITGAASDAWDWTTDTASDVGSAVADTASSAWDWTKDTASNVGSTVADAASGAWDFTKGAASGIYGGMKSAAGYVRKGEQAFEHGVDWLEDQASRGAHWAANKAEGIPGLEQLANGGAWLVDQQAQLTGGVLKGAGSLVGGVAQMAVDPVDTALGVERLMEHNMVTGMPLKFAHGLYDMAANGREFSDVLDASFNPVRSFQDDMSFYKGMASGLIQPYRESIEKGKYAEAGGRAIFDIGSLILTGGESAAVEGAADVGRVAGVLGEAGDVARASELGELARGAELADVARGAEVADAARAGELGDLARGAEAGDVARGAEVSEAGRPTVYEPHPFEFSETAPSGLEPVTPAPAEFPIPEVVGEGHPPSGLELDDSLFSGLSDEEVGMAVENAESGVMVSAPAPTRLRLGKGQAEYWGTEPGTGMTVQEYQFPAQRGLPRRNAAGEILPGPHGDVKTSMRVHSPDLTAPVGSTSAEGWTVNVEQGDARMTGEGQWFDTRYGELPGGGRVDLRPFRRGPDGAWINEKTGAAVDEATIQLLEEWDRNMASSHIPLP